MKNKYSRSFYRRWFLGCCSLLLLLFAAGCGKDRVRGTQTRLLVVNASPNAGSLDLLQNLRKIGTGSFPYLNIPEWRNPVLFEADSGFQNYQVLKGNTVVASFLRINTGTQNSLWMFDTIAADRFRYIVLQDRLDTPGRAKAKIRFLHLSPDADTVNLFFNAAVVDANWSYFSQELVNRTLLDEFFVVDTGAVQFRIRQKTSQQFVKAYQLHLQSNGVYTFVMKGYLNRSGSDSLSITRIIHN